VALPRKGKLGGVTVVSSPEGVAVLERSKSKVKSDHSCRL
jgi:hypothetical protein